MSITHLNKWSFFHKMFKVAYIYAVASFYHTCTQQNQKNYDTIRCLTIKNLVGVPPPLTHSPQCSHWLRKEKVLVLCLFWVKRTSALSNRHCGNNGTKSQSFTGSYLTTENNSAQTQKRSEIIMKITKSK